MQIAMKILTRKKKESTTFTTERQTFSSNIFTLPRKDISPTAMDIQHVTERIIVLLFSSTVTNAQYRVGLKDAIMLLQYEHSERYKIFNVSRKRSDLGRLYPVIEVGWPQELAPPLDRLCSICKLLANWLSANPDNLVVIHCKGGHARAAIVISAYLHYATTCSIDLSIGNRFALQRFSERYIGFDGQPSYKRYVNYFSALISGRTKIQPATVYLHHIVLENLPGRNVIFKIYERMQPVHTTLFTDTGENSIIELEDLPLRGDILVKCFHRINSAERASFFRCQFNTCTFDLTTDDGNIYKLRFYREELDDICIDSEVDPQAAIEFLFLKEVTKSGAAISAKGATATVACDTVRRSIVDFSHADSYENFDKEEEDRSEPSEADGINGTEYTEIHRPTDSTDSGIGSDSANTSKDKGVMPPLPPKPYFNTGAKMNDHYFESTRGNAQVITRAHSALPASVRPMPAGQPKSPIEERVIPPRAIEPDLVAKDRYDPASKCFSYVPARALSEHFTTSRKPQRPKAKEPVTALFNLEPPTSEITSISVKSAELQRRPELKWEDDIDKVNNGYCQQSKVEDLCATLSDFHGSGKTSTMNSTLEVETSKSESLADVEEKPVVMDQAKRASRQRQTKYGPYKTLNDAAYNSDMDELCDPDFYLSYMSQPTVPTMSFTSFPKNSVVPSKNNFDLTINNDEYPTELVFANNATTNGHDLKRANLPRRPVKESLQQDQAALDSYFSSPKPATSLSNINHNKEVFRMRNCRSATSAPFHRESQGSRLFAHDHYDSLTDAENADDWLKFQLRKLKAKKESDPEVLRRKRQEKLLLEELKHVSNDKRAARERDERTYSVEGFGQHSDLLNEYRMEEERLQNVRTVSSDNGRIPEELPYSVRRVMPPKSLNVVKHKPPTPPLRARSRSPPRSPYLRRSRARTPHQESKSICSERNHLSRSESNEADTRGVGDDELSHLRHTAKEGNSVSGSTHADYNLSTNSMKSILKKRDIQHETLSPVVNHRGSVLVEEWSSSSRAATPSFPVRRETPLPYHPLLFEGAKDVMPQTQSFNDITHRSPSPRSIYYTQSHRTSMSSTELGDVIHHHPLFVKDISKYWYKPTISREEAINMLKNKPPGTFVVRDSNSFPGAFGLALKVATPPPGVHPGDGTELVRHFLIEPSPKGVKLKGCNNEPVFGTLSALVYQHSITPLALPAKLLLPDYDPANIPEHISAAQTLLQQGAACNVTYIVSLDTESLTGPEAVRRCIGEIFELLKQKMLQPVSVHFKVSAQGITITDNTRRLFFRRHYPVHSVTYAGLDPSDRRWDNSHLNGNMTNYVKSAKMFAFVARKIGSRTDNACHVFAELEPEQPATAVVNFITKVMMGRR